MYYKKFFITILFLGNVFGKDDFSKNKILIYIENHVPEFMICKDSISSNYEELNDLLEQTNAKWIYKWLPRAKPIDRDGSVHLDNYYLVEFISKIPNLDKVVAAFQSLSLVRIAEKVPIIIPLYTPNDELWDEQYGLRQIKADAAYDLWDIEIGEIPGQSDEHQILVGIVDLGFKWDHPDLINNVWRNLGEDADGDGDVIEYLEGGWVFDPEDLNNIDDDGDGYIDNFIGYDVYSDDNNPHTGEQHGTMVAGCVSSQTNNEEGIASVGWSVKLVGINSGSGGTLPAGYEGILAAAHMGVDIINCSWGMSSYLESNEAVINTVYNQYGILSVSAAGNFGVNEPHYPASYDNVISVTATGPGNNFNCWPNFHSTVDISAPGQDIITTANSSNLYETVTGTSFSSPIVAGGIALIKSIFPHADNQMLRSKIISSAGYYSDMDSYCGDENLEGLLGAGQLDIYQAILYNIDPQFSVNDILILNDNGVQIPGDTTIFIVSINNLTGSIPVENIQATISTDNNYLTILEGVNTHSNPVPSGNSFDCQFVITTSEEISLGNIQLNLTITADISGNLPSNVHFEEYLFSSEIHLPVGMSQEGYPVDISNISGVSTFTDLYGNSPRQIYFNSDSILYGKWISGYDVTGFPFFADSKIITTAASGDLNGDGDKEIVFGTEDGTIFVLNKDGSEYFRFIQNSDIIKYPMLSNLNNNSFLEIVFIATEDTLSTLYAIDINGENLEGFPINFTEIITEGLSSADFDNDGSNDIVIVDNSGNVFLINGFGEIFNGFPLNIAAIPSGPPTISNIDNITGLEILIPTKNSGIFVLDQLGNIILNINPDQSIVNGIAISDLDYNGNLEIIYATKENAIHAYDYSNQTEMNGWPYFMSDSITTEPLIFDFDANDMQEIIIGSLDGRITIINYNGTDYSNFPYISNDTIIHTPSVGDLDLDDDYEVIFTTNTQLNVLDLSIQVTDKYSWDTYRSNNHRNGFFNISNLDLSLNGTILPNNFWLGDNYPNPFNPKTHIPFNIPYSDEVNFNIYDINGHIIKNLSYSNFSAGKNSIVWDGVNKRGEKVSSGVYFYSLEYGKFSKTKKMILLK